LSQSKKMSFLESWVNIFIGYTINFVANIVILPAFGFKSLTLKKNLVIGIIYTGISLARTYTIRRWFDKKDGVNLRRKI